MGSGKCRCPPPPMEIPKWFMTYSDVITLLMTFFILLLTFASSEPENFAQMQIATFGGSGGSGIAGAKPTSQDKDSLTVRYRPSAARRTARGSESAPLDITPIGESASKGLDALENPDQLMSAERVSTETRMDGLRDSDGKLNSRGVQQLRLMAIQMKSLGLNAEMQVSNSEDISFAVGMARYLQDELKVPLGQISVSVGTTSANSSTLKTTLTRIKQ